MVFDARVIANAVSKREFRNEKQEKKTGTKLGMEVGKRLFI